MGRGDKRGVVGAATAVVAMMFAPGIRVAGRKTQSGRTAAGKPDFSGIWQADNEAHWDLQAREALPGMVMQQGMYPYDYARVLAAPVVALGAAGRAGFTWP